MPSPSLRFFTTAFALLSGTLVTAVLASGIVTPRRAVSEETAAQPAPKLTPEAVAFFETRVRPVLANSCVSCHGKDTQLGGLRLDSREAILKGGESGPSIVLGTPEKSLLITAVHQTSKLKMPQGGKLKPEEIAALADWVKMGAPWPATSTAPTAVDTKANLWSLRPVTLPKSPVVKNAAWCNSPIDRFVLAKLEAKSLTPAPEADKRTLLRRVTYDVTGLPPTAAEVDAFLADKSPDAYEKVVDRLLASPRYGERAARLWLDVARYADTKGYVFEEDRNYPNAYTYRDWVINAFNSDLPYDQFVIRQLAADRLPLGEDKSDLAALGFLTVGRRFLNNMPDIMDDRIDVTMRGLQGFTVACARCHDHKFDPIPTQDYYSLYAIFAATKETAPQIAKEPMRVAMAVEDTEKPEEQHIFKRGNPGNPGDVAPRRFLLALSPKDKPRAEWTQGSGRLELAKAIASPTNPLTARVFVNRIWRWHFGNGIVRTPSDFGHQGEKPTNPELLDYLASAFVKDGWSIKKLHRRILLSATYRQASRFDAKAFAADPENRLLWRQNRRRLDLEQMRDSLLETSNKLDMSTVGGPSIELWTAPFNYRRAIYGRVERQNLPQAFRVFDFASPDSTNAGRFTTTVPQQTLFFLNAPLVVEQARTLVTLPEITSASDDATRIKRLYRRLFGRGPTPEESALGLRFLTPTTADNSTNPVILAPWAYGYGAWDNAAGRVTSFTPLPHFTGSTYQGGPVMPDPKLHYLTLSAEGGHPGDDEGESIIRRFIAPRDMTVSVSGTLGHGQPKGDGVQAVMVLSRGGVLGRWSAFNNSVATNVDKVELRRGDTLDFVVSPGPGGCGFDSFTWAPTIKEIGAKSQTWSAKSDFEAPYPAHLARREQYAQALLMTNEFMFVD